MQKTVKELAQLINGNVIGDDSLLVIGITNMENPLEGNITFAQDEKSFKKLDNSPISCLIVPTSIETSSKTIIQTENPKLAWAKLLHVFYPKESFSGTISEKASVAKSAVIGKNVTIEAFAVVSDDATIGDGTVLKAHSFVGKNVKIGNDSLIHPSVVIYNNSLIGSNVIIHAGTVVGSDGFGYVATLTALEKVPQVGNVIIEDHVEIGANVTIDCATVGSTKIGMCCKIDNQVQIAHNVQIGPCTVISAQSGISGSSKIGSQVTMGGKVGVGDHVEIGDKTMVGAGAGFPSGKKVPGGQIVFGEPARPYAVARRQIAAQLRAAETLEDVKKLKARLKEIEKKLN